jgi:hypothetical protein
MRPIGTHGKEIVSALIHRGCTYENEPQAVTAVYRRAVKEGWNDVASELLSCGGDKTEIEDGLILISKSLAPREHSRRMPL